MIAAGHVNTAKLARVDIDGSVKPEIQIFDLGMIHVAVEAFRQSFNNIQEAKKDIGSSTGAPF